MMPDKSSIINHHSSFRYFAVGLVLCLAACRSTVSEKPPVHIVPNMDFQERFDPQEANDFFADGRSMRTPVAGTIPRGALREDTRFFEGLTDTGELVEVAPVSTTMEILERGRRQFDIFCAVCHGRSGDGRGPIMTGDFGYVPAPSFHTDALRALPDGHYYRAIKDGIRTMPSYAQQIPVADRWAIVLYIRALQKSQNATSDQIPESVLEEVRQRGSANITVTAN